MIETCRFLSLDLSRWCDPFGQFFLTRKRSCNMTVDILNYRLNV